MEDNGPSKILWLSFYSSKKSIFEKMSDVRQFIIGECVTAKAIHVLHLSECARRYGSDKKTKRLVGLVVTNVNIPTSTSRASWFVRVRFHLGGAHTKLHKLSVRSVKKAPTLVIHEEIQEIHDAVPIDGRLLVDINCSKSRRRRDSSTQQWRRSSYSYCP